MLFVISYPLEDLRMLVRFIITSKQTRRECLLAGIPDTTSHTFKAIFSSLFQISCLFQFFVRGLYNSYLLISCVPNPSFDLFQIGAL